MFYVITDSCIFEPWEVRTQYSWVIHGNIFWKWDLVCFILSRCWRTVSKIFKFLTSIPLLLLFITHICNYHYRLPKYTFLKTQLSILFFLSFCRLLKCSGVKQDKLIFAEEKLETILNIFNLIISYASKIRSNILTIRIKTSL